MNGLSVGKQTGMSNNHWHLQSTQGPRLVFNDSLILAEAHIIRAWMRPADCEIAKLVLVVSCNCNSLDRSSTDRFGGPPVVVYVSLLQYQY